MKMQSSITNKTLHVYNEQKKDDKQIKSFDLNVNESKIFFAKLKHE